MFSWFLERPIIASNPTKFIYALVIMKSVVYHMFGLKFNQLQLEPFIIHAYNILTNNGPIPTIKISRPSGRINLYLKRTL